MKSYEKLSQESEKSWQAFVCYREMGVERSLTMVAQALHKSRVLLGRWSRTHNWVERVGPWDNDQQRIRDEAHSRALTKATEKATMQQEISAQRILQEQAHLAFSRVHRIAPWSNVPGLVDSDQLSDADLASIKSMKVTTDEDGNTSVTLQLWDKQPALDKLGQHKKLWGSKDDNAPDQQNFVQFFLEAVKSGELQREAERRGLVPRSTIEAEVIEVKKG
jgi:hypothetical protein